MKNFKPELLLPAGNLSKLKLAISYGADAVYLAGMKFGLRTAADNFTNEELIEGVNFAHEHFAKVYTVINSFLHDEDLEDLDEFIKFLESIKVDGVIVSDLGVISKIKHISNLNVHLSTQASCINLETAKFWKRLGVSRVVLGRETSIKNAGRIKELTGLEVEMFIHGAMCMSISGKCSLSNYTSGRDSNRGGCAQNCRFLYHLECPELHRSVDSFFLSSKDLCGINRIEDFKNFKIDSLKIEGRMKAKQYAGIMASSYRRALDSLTPVEDVNFVTHRAYTEASLMHPADTSSVYFEREHEESLYINIGSVIDIAENKFIMVQVLSAFKPGDCLEIVTFKNGVKTVNLDFVKNFLDQDVDKTKPGTCAKIPYVLGTEINNLVRMKVKA